MAWEAIGWIRGRCCIVRGIRTGVEIPRPSGFKIASGSSGYRAVTCSNGQTEMRASGDHPAYIPRSQSDALLRRLRLGLARPPLMQVIAFALVP
jgi:hypothetical protein